MTATIVTIGDEILIGQITDTNSGYIARALEKIGIRVVEMLSISDDRSHILQTFERLQDRTDLVIITGGLGPTKDDITKKTFCDYFDDQLIVDQNVLAHITAMYERVFKMPVSQVNKDQALVPSKATVLHNEFGSAPGMWIKKGNTAFVSMPGVPFEMKGILDNHLIPKLIAEFDRPFIIHKTVMTYGLGESLIAERIEDWENNLPEFIKLAYLPAPGRVRLRLSARGKDKAILEKAIDENIATLHTLIGEIITGFDDGGSIESAVGGLLKAKRQSLSVAESCTGGKISQLLTSVAGASKYFKGGIVCYSAQSKIELLGVSPEIIARHSVVSDKTAAEMAVRCRQKFNSDFAISVTGNAGPSKDETDHGVGIVFIAVATPNGVTVSEFNFGQPREKVIDRAANKALELLRSALTSENNDNQA